MALLSIAEPGQSQAPHQHRLAVGIDLGTTHSLVAAVRDGSPEILRDAEGARLLPSVVRYFADGSVVVGEDARRARVEDPRNTLASMKRLMGRGLAEVPQSLARSYELVGDGGRAAVATIAGPRGPVEAAAQILRTLRERAEAALGGELVGAVITVPAYFDDAQRQATKDAARIAGLNVLRLLNEPTAAAVAYGLDNAGAGIHAIYDLGGGTFDISILRLSRGVFEVLAVGGDAALGGDDFDQAVFEWMLETAQLADPGPVDRQLLLLQARRAKECLSFHEEAEIFARLADGRAVSLTLSRAEFERRAAPLVARTLAPVRKALRDAQLTAQDVDEVVLVGGATRMPAVRAAVAGLFHREPLTDIDPDEAVALGAAVQADVLAGNRSGEDWLLLDVTPLSLGLETMGGLVERIIPRNSTLPAARAQDFTTFRDGQTALAVHVVQGERERVADCRSLARFELRGIPPMAAGAARIRVTFQVDADGLLAVGAREQISGIEASVVVKPSYGLGEEEITAMLRDSHIHAEDDARSRALQEQVVEAERLLESLEAAIAADGQEWLDAAERGTLDAAMAALRAAVAAGDAAAMRGTAEHLNQLSTPLAARRMDNAIRKAMSGRQLTEFA